MNHHPSPVPPGEGATWGPWIVWVIVIAWAIGAVLGFVQGLALLTLAGFVAGTIGIRYPVAGLLGVGVLTVLDPLARHLLLNAGGVFRWNTLNYWLLMLAGLWLNRLFRLSDPHSRLLAALLAVLTVGLILAPHWAAGFQSLINLSSVFVLVICFQRTPRDADTMYWVGLVMSLTAAIGGFEFYREIETFPMNKNAFALFPLAGVLGACLAVPFTSGRRQLLLVSLATLDTVWVFLSGSRGNFAVALLALGFMLAALPRRQCVAYLALALALGLGVANTFDRLEGRAVSRLTKLVNGSVSAEERTSGRLNLAVGGWMLFLQNPLGVGTGAFEDKWASLDQHGEQRFARGKEVPAHSAWVMVLAENGVPGIVLLTAYVCSFAMVGLLRRRADLVRLGLLGSSVLAVGFVSSEFQSKALWFTAAAVTALLHADPWRTRSLAPMRPLVSPPSADA